MIHTLLQSHTGRVTLRSEPELRSLGRSGARSDGDLDSAHCQLLRVNLPRMLGVSIRHQLQETDKPAKPGMKGETGGGAG